MINRNDVISAGDFCTTQCSGCCVVKSGAIRDQNTKTLAREKTRFFGNTCQNERSEKNTGLSQSESAYAAVYAGLFTTGVSLNRSRVSTMVLFFAVGRRAQQAAC